jgi:hypothetical protein
MKKMFIFAITIAAVGGGLYAWEKRLNHQEYLKLRTHVTIYMKPPLLTKGGMVKVVATIIPEAEWQDLEGKNLLDIYPDNPKLNDLKPEDMLVSVSAKEVFTVVEMFYPEGGSIGFNFASHPEVENPPQIGTERLSAGSGGWNESADLIHYWDSTNTIHVFGYEATKSESRLVAVNLTKILDLGVPTQRYKGVTVYSPTAEQVADATRNRRQ